MAVFQGPWKQTSRPPIQENPPIASIGHDGVVELLP